MNRFVLGLLIIAGGWGATQDVARAEPPSAEALWALLGSVSTISLEVHSPGARNIRFVIMYQGEIVIGASQRLDPEDDPVATFSAGALGPAVGMRSCEDGALAFIHHRVVRDAGADGSGGGTRSACVPFENLFTVFDRGGAAPLARPPEHHEDHPLAIPLDTWLLFGATDLVPVGGPVPEAIDQALTHYFMLSAEFVTPPADLWELPAYETWQDAYDVFDDLP